MTFEPAEAQAIYERLIREVVRMLCAGVVHGDLSEFNVLVGGDGPVIIDFPQSVDTAHNTNARALLLRDVENLHRFRERFVPGARRLPYAEEMWSLYQQNALTPDTRLGGRFATRERRVDMSGVLDLIQDANRDERKRREALGLRGGPPREPDWAPRQQASSPGRPDRTHRGDAPPRQDGPPQRPRAEHASSPRPPAAPEPARSAAPARPQPGWRGRAHDDKATEKRGVEVMFVRRPR